MKILLLIENKMLDKENWGGGKGLIREVEKEINKYADVDVEFVKPSKRKLIRIFYQYGGYLLRKRKIKGESYDKILVFPGYLFWIIPCIWWKKTIVFGPDSMILNSLSLYRVTENFFRKNILRRIYICLSKINEGLILKFCDKYIVVGNTDKKCMDRMFPRYITKTKFIHHPLLSQEQQNIDEFKYDSSVKYKRFIFSGDLVKTFQEINIRKLVNALKYNLNSYNKDINILVVGRNNYWVYELFIGIPHVNVKYIKYVKNYFDICKSGQDVHCIPLASGSGTKNRTLTAIANGVEVITTSTGIENIKWHGLTHTYIRSNMNDFAEMMIKINVNLLDNKEYNMMLNKRIEFVHMMNNIKSYEIKNIIEK